MNPKKQVMIEIAAGFQNSFDSVFMTTDERLGNLRRRLSELDVASKSASSLKELTAESEQLKLKIDADQNSLRGLNSAFVDATKRSDEQKRKTAELTQEMENHLAVLNKTKAKESDLREEVNRLSKSKAEQKKQLKDAKLEVKSLGESFERSKKSYWDHIEASKQDALAGKLNAEQMAANAAKARVLSSEMDAGLTAYMRAKAKIPQYRAEIEKTNTALTEQKNKAASVRKEVNGFERTYSASKNTLWGHRTAVAAENRVLAENGQTVSFLKGKIRETERELKSNTAAFNSQTSAIKEYKGALEGAGHQTQDFSSLEQGLGQALAKSQKSFASASRLKKISDRGRELRGEIVGGAFELTGMALSLGTPVKIAAEFDHAMAKVGAQTMATAEEMDVLTKKARLLGDTTVFSSTDAATAESYLATAGFGVQDIVDSLPGVLDLAAAGEVGLGESAEMASNMLAAFRLDATEMVRVANVMTATFISTNTDLTGLAETMKYAAPIASALGASIEEVSAASGLLGNVGIQGSMAGTALRAMYQRLAAPPAAGREALTQLKVSLRDVHKNLLPLPAILEQLDKKLAGKGTAERAKFIKDIFGEEAAGAATALLDSAGSGSLKFEIKKLEMAPAFRASLKYLQDNMTAADLNGLEQRFGIAFKDGMSKAAKVTEFSKAFAGLKGADFEKRFSEIFRFTPAVDKMELDVDTKAAKAKLKELKIERRGGDKKDKSFDQLSKEIESALAKLPEPKKLEAMSVLFARSRNEMHALMEEASQGEKKFGQLSDALEKTNSAEEISARLNATTVGAWKNLQSSVEAVAISVGSVFLPKLSEMMKSLADGALVISGMASEHDKIVTAIGYFGAALATAKAAMLGYKSILWAINGVVEILTIAQTALNFVMEINPVVATISAMLILISAIWAAFKHWDAVLQWLKNAKEWIIDLWGDLKPIMKSIGEFLSFGETRDVRFSKNLELNESAYFRNLMLGVPEAALQSEGNRNQVINLQQKFDIAVQGEDAPQKTALKIKEEMKAGFKSSAFSYVDPLSF